jgi:hypothetical protein
MGWEDDHLHRFRIHGRDYGIEETDGMPFDEDAEDVPLSRFGFRPAERFLYEYDFADGWEAEIRVEKVIDEVGIRREADPSVHCRPRASAARRKRRAAKVRGTASRHGQPNFDR